MLKLLLIARDSTSITFKKYKSKESFYLDLILSTGGSVDVNSDGEMIIDWVKIEQKVDFSVVAPDRICLGEEADIYVDSPGGISGISWTVSDNLQIEATENEGQSIRVSRLPSTSSNLGIIEASIPNVNSCHEARLVESLEVGYIQPSGIIANADGSQQVLNTVNFVTQISSQVFINDFTYTGWELVSGSGYIAGIPGGNRFIANAYDGFAHFLVHGQIDGCDVTYDFYFITYNLWYQISPNPATSQLTVEAIQQEYTLTYTSVNGSIEEQLISPLIKKIKIFDPNSGFILKQQELSQETSLISIDISTFSTGIYMIEILNKDDIGHVYSFTKN